jgi:Ni,Fe-hydrogenase III small subunit
MIAAPVMTARAAYMPALRMVVAFEARRPSGVLHRSPGCPEEDDRVNGTDACQVPGAPPEPNVCLKAFARMVIHLIEPEKAEWWKQDRHCRGLSYPFPSCNHTRPKPQNSIVTSRRL